MNSEPRRIPTNVITGFLGTGKTTAIQTLLKQRPDAERWSIFVNEYGMVTIDELLLDQQTPEVSVRELGGGCLCCTMAFAFDPLLTQFIRLSKPDRLIIEPSGSGHPAALIDTLRNKKFGRLIDLRATICIVDPKDFHDPKRRETAVFYDQIQMADVVAINFTDRRDAAMIAECRRWIEAFDPPKTLVVETSHGEIDPAWLDTDRTLFRPPKFGDAHSHNHAPAEDPASLVSIDVPPLPGQPKRIENEGDGQWACGWIFSHEEVFDFDELLDLLGYVQPVLRLKGVFRCQDDWWVINRSKQETSFHRSAYRRDSRLEIIINKKTSGWVEFENMILACRIAKSAEETTGKM